LRCVPVQKDLDTFSNSSIPLLRGVLLSPFAGGKPHTSLPEVS
jgi:hypothetical protein